ncbi:MAG: tRNA lysidine(34) synthetase TilS [Tenericutes bacterium HGW-Tenericutes-1]|jgi:tRNA(Ile)-lysidine synthetase-like protein|nr:MAG: tRNA lysidine(34) synthetase TilS [Tenericutes bacterium HGW-Tenericutes-1]
MKILLNKSLIQKNDIIVVAVSGGIDSMVLLDQLNQIKTSMKLQLIVAHVNHAKRSASIEEYEFVKNTALKYHNDFEGTTLEKLPKSNFHTVSRSKRYEFFKQVCEKYHANKLALAHHLDDQTETVLMRIIRGTSFKGYGGIHESTKIDNIEVIRPLLNVSRNDIVKYQETNHLEYRHDSSNDLDDYTRNRFRHHVIPTIEKENKEYRSKFMQFTNYMQEANSLVEQMSASFMNDHVSSNNGTIIFNVGIFNTQNRIVKRDILKKSYDLLTNNSCEISFKQMNQLLSILESEKPNASMTLSNDWVAIRSYDTLTFAKQSKFYESLESIEMNQEGIYPFKDDIFTVSKTKPNINSGICLELWYNNLDFIFPITVRNRRDGDKIMTESGTKKLKDLFMDLKIPKALRDDVPVVIDSLGNILWIPGYRVSSDAKIGDQVLYIAYKRGKSC